MAKKLVMWNLNNTLVRSVNDRGDDWLLPGDEWEYCEGAESALALFTLAGWHQAVVTNQPAEHRFKNVTHDDMLELMAEIDIALHTAAVPMACGSLSLYVCYHDASDECDCRKPKSGLLRQAMGGYTQQLTVDWWIIGDKWRDMLAGQRASIKTCKIGAFGYQRKGKWNGPLFTYTEDEPPEELRPPDFWVADALSAAKIITGVEL